MFKRQNKERNMGHTAGEKNYDFREFPQFFVTRPLLDSHCVFFIFLYKSSLIYKEIQESFSLLLLVAVKTRHEIIFLLLSFNNSLSLLFVFCLLLIKIDVIFVLEKSQGTNNN